MRIAPLLLSLALLPTLAAADGEGVKLSTPKDKISYGMGVELARNFKKNEMDVDIDLFIKGLQAGMSGEKIPLPEKELRRAINSYQSEVRQKMAMNRRTAAETNRKKGAAYLAENRTRDGVQTLPSGVQYRIIKKGTGKIPGDQSSITCFYRGTLLDGTEFDGTEPDKPATLKVSQLIAGWKEALKLMPEGSKWEIFIPSQLAYGERGVGNDIGPNETLRFEVELLTVQ